MIDEYKFACYYLKLRDTAIKVARKEGVSVDDAYEAATWNECLWGFWPEEYQTKKYILHDAKESREYDRAMTP